MVKSSYFHQLLHISVLIFLFIQVSGTDHISAQDGNYKYYYRIYFRDKGENNTGNFTASDLLSQKAIDRRVKSGITVPDFRDIPVYSGYLSQISSLGLTLHTTSRWMNTALFKTEDLIDINLIQNLSYVKDAKIVKHPGLKTFYRNKLDFEIDKPESEDNNQPISMLNGAVVQSSGFMGNGILIAVLDGGFYNTDNISSLEALRNRDGIEGTFDFVNKNEFVFDYHDHGTAVLSVLAGSIPELIQGSAPGASYWLLRTEDTATEFPVEEDFWAAGAEFADSVGADIISSSLGYFTFDDPLMDYKYSDMDGNSTFVTRVADIAASKGILVVNSAGNERNKEWHYIISPSDGDSVLSVGAVDRNKTISSFSSAGPAYDGRIKPDIMAQGVYVPVQVHPSDVAQSSGTSFSCPIISGMCACIMQAVPGSTNYDIISVLQASADRYLNPDTLYGYGIPDISIAIRKLQDKYIIRPEGELLINPNPFNNELHITFKEPPGTMTIELFDLNGRIIVKHNYDNYISRTLNINGLQDYPNGFYIVRMTSQNGTFIQKAIKRKR